MAASAVRPHISSLKLLTDIVFIICDALTTGRSVIDLFRGTGKAVVSLGALIHDCFLFLLNKPVRRRIDQPTPTLTDTAFGIIGAIFWIAMIAGIWMLLS